MTDATETKLWRTMCILLAVALALMTWSSWLANEERSREWEARVDLQRELSALQDEINPDCYVTVMGDGRVFVTAMTRECPQQMLDWFKSGGIVIEEPEVGE